MPHHALIPLRSSAFRVQRRPHGAAQPLANNRADILTHIPARIPAHRSPNGGFAAGTHIRTFRGPVAVEHLRRGDLILDADGGLHVLRDTAQRCVGPQGVVNIDPGALMADGAEGPQDTTLSLAACQPVLYADWRTCVLGNAEPVPVAAGRLCDGLRVRRSRATATQVHTLAFDMGVTVLANGLPCPCPARRRRHPAAVAESGCRSGSRHGSPGSAARPRSLFQGVSLAGWHNSAD